LAAAQRTADLGPQFDPIDCRGLAERARPFWGLRHEARFAVMGASNFLYAEATSTQTLPDWIGSHVRAFTYFTRFTTGS
jgi:hypothetical protein